MSEIQISGDVLSLSKKNLSIESMTLSKGYLYTVIGKNAAGKSTFIDLLSDAGKPIFGQNQIGYISSRFDLLIAFSKKKLIDLYQRGNARFQETLFTEYLTLFDLETFDHMKTLSKGECKLVYLCLTLATRPDVLLMDEFFNGLDAVNKYKVIELLQEFVSDFNKVCIQATNSVEDIIEISDYFIIVSDGLVMKPQDQVYLVENYVVDNVTYEDFKKMETGVLAFVDLGERVEILKKRTDQPPTNLESIVSLIGGI